MARPYRLRSRLSEREELHWRWPLQQGADDAGDMAAVPVRVQEDRFGNVRFEREINSGDDLSGTVECGHGSYASVDDGNMHAGAGDALLPSFACADLVDHIEHRSGMIEARVARHRPVHRRLAEEGAVQRVRCVRRQAPDHVEWICSKKHTKQGQKRQQQEVAQYKMTNANEGRAQSQEGN